MRVAIVLVGLALAGCAAPEDARTTVTPAGPVSVSVLDNRFDPASLAVAAGRTATFTHEGHNPHTVTIHWVGDNVTTFRLDKRLDHGQSLSYTFIDAGTYHVFCKYHGGMTTGMSMVVEAAQA